MKRKKKVIGKTRREFAHEFMQERIAETLSNPGISARDAVNMLGTKEMERVLRNAPMIKRITRRKP